MAYTLGQYHKSPNQDNQDGVFMTLVTGDEVPTADRRDGRISPIAKIDDLEFQDECLTSSVGFLSSNSYYFHGKVKKMHWTTQRFYVKLVDDTDETDDTEQFIKEIIIPQGISDIDENENLIPGSDKGWYDIEFTFTPTRTFNRLWFQLIRTKEDYIVEVNSEGEVIDGGARYPKIIYEELSIMDNLLNKEKFQNMDAGIIKMGIQGRPHFPMFINKEEIRTDRSGIYEIKNGNVLVTSFSVIGRAKDNDESQLKNAMINIDTQIGESKKSSVWEPIPSVNLMGIPKTRIIDSFTMDYMFREKVKE